MPWVEPREGPCVGHPWSSGPGGQQVRLRALLSTQETQRRVWAALLAPLQPEPPESVCRERPVSQHPVPH